ncbi:MAG: hypothetical protein WBE34_02315 [Candidatus Nitrosopolaris sp.]
MKKVKTLACASVAIPIIRIPREESIKQIVNDVEKQIESMSSSNDKGKRENIEQIPTEEKHNK